MSTATYGSGSDKRSAFSLIELLTVVCVIAVLAALTFPALSRAGSLSKSSKCKSNLRQLALALQMYVADDNCYPMFAHWDGDQSTFWPEMLGQLLSQNVTGQVIPTTRVTVFTCPSLGQATLQYVTYGYNGLGFAFLGLGAKPVRMANTITEIAVSEGEVRVPADAIALGDGIGRLSSGPLMDTGILLNRWLLAPPEGNNAGELKRGDALVRSRHAGRANVAFCDGHVESNTLKVLFEDTSDGALRRWNRDHEPHRDWLIE